MFQFMRALRARFHSLSACRRSLCRLATIVSSGGRNSERVDAALFQGKAGDVRRLGCERGERRHGLVGLLVGQERADCGERECRPSMRAGEFANLYLRQLVQLYPGALKKVN